jgi:hypothetical protein
MTDAETLQHLAVYWTAYIRTSSELGRNTVNMPHVHLLELCDALRWATDQLNANTAQLIEARAEQQRLQQIANDHR